MVLPWNENYGESNDNRDSSMYQQFSLGWRTTLSDSGIWRIGLTQALSEGAMYTVSHVDLQTAIGRYQLLLTIILPIAVCFHVGSDPSIS